MPVNALMAIWMPFLVVTVIVMAGISKTRR